MSKGYDYTTKYFKTREIVEPLSTFPVTGSEGDHTFHCRNGKRNRDEMDAEVCSGDEGCALEFCFSAGNVLNWDLTIKGLVGLLVGLLNHFPQCIPCAAVPL